MFNNVRFLFSINLTCAMQAKMFENLFPRERLTVSTRRPVPEYSQECPSTEQANKLCRLWIAMDYDKTMDCYTKVKMNKLYLHMKT